MDQPKVIRDVVVVGSGSAGLLAALALKRKLPQLNVRVVRDQAIGVIGVGESTTPGIPTFLFSYLGISPRHFYKIANPTWKMGIHFLWGPRPHFEYSFGHQLDVVREGLPKPNGFYVEEEFKYADVGAALMAHKKAFQRGANGSPDLRDYAFHLYNPDFVAALESVGKVSGIEFIEGTLSEVVRGEAGVAAIALADGRRVAGDLFIDASGFRSELLGKGLGEPFLSFGSSLYCDRAVVGSWERTSEPILPYTTAETMDAGWCWQIEHEKQINRGYVFCSSVLSDDQARDEFLRKNPKAKTWDHTVKFRSGRYQRSWVENVIGVGNACGFVEPLEATALMVLGTQLRTLVHMLSDSQLAPPPTIRELYNEVFQSTWDEIRWFLSLHYRFNTRLDTPFWKQCRADVDVSGVSEFLRFYQENGPLGLCRHRMAARRLEFGLDSGFGLEGFLVILTGNRVPYRKYHQPTAQEWALWNAGQAQLEQVARNGFTVAEALAMIRDPRWTWHAEQAGRSVIST